MNILYVFSECCYMFKFNLATNFRLIVTNLRKITCDEYYMLVAKHNGLQRSNGIPRSERSNSIPGSAWGKSLYCPRNAAEAGRLWKIQNQQRGSLRICQNFVSSKFRPNIPTFKAKVLRKTRELVWPICARRTLLQKENHLASLGGWKKSNGDGGGSEVFQDQPGG